MEEQIRHAVGAPRYWHVFQESLAGMGVGIKVSAEEEEEPAECS